MEPCSNPIDDHLVEGLETAVVKLEPHPLLSPANTTPEWWYRIGSNDVAPTDLPPRVPIVHPEEGDVFESPTDLRLAAAAHDADGWVRTVEFFDGNVSLGVVSNSLSSVGRNGGPDATGISPEQLFLLPWLNVPPGTHRHAIDDNLPECIETVRLHLTLPPVSPATYEIGRPARAGAVILDNDHLLLSPEPIADGLHLRLAVFEGMPFRLESSTDLLNWEEEASGFAVEDGISIVPETSGQPPRFFRVVPDFGDLDED